jgi:hypothetical protein
MIRMKFIEDMGDLNTGTSQGARGTLELEGKRNLLRDSDKDKVGGRSIPQNTDSMEVLNPAATWYRLGY